MDDRTVTDNTTTDTTDADTTDESGPVLGGAPGLPSAFADSVQREDESVVERSQRTARLSDVDGAIDVNLGGEGVRAAAPHLFPAKRGGPAQAIDAVDTTGVPEAQGALSSDRALPDDQRGAVTQRGADGSYIDTTEHGTSTGAEVKSAVQRERDRRTGTVIPPQGLEPDGAGGMTSGIPADEVTEKDLADASAGDGVADSHSSSDAKVNEEPVPGERGGAKADKGDHATKPQGSTSGSGAPSGQ